MYGKIFKFIPHEYLETSVGTGVVQTAMLPLSLLLQKLHWQKGTGCHTCRFQNLKVSQMADDTIIFISKLQSVKSTLEELDKVKFFSGIKNIHLSLNKAYI